MYYRYETRKKSRSFKRLFFFIFFSALIYSAYYYSDYLKFWKHSENHILQLIESTEHIKDPAEKKTALKRVLNEIDYFGKDRIANPEVYYFKAKVHYKLGLLDAGDSFSGLLIKDIIPVENAGARDSFYSCLREINRAVALYRDEKRLGDYAVMKAMTEYYLDYQPLSQIYSALRDFCRDRVFTDIEENRFFAFMNIINGNPEAGFEHLARYGYADDTINGSLLRATIDYLSGNYTEAINSFKTILSESRDRNINKLVYVKLGKIYFRQSLFPESVESFAQASALDSADYDIKVWIGKNYLALGEKEKARAIFSEVIASGNRHQEALKLLSVM